MDLQLDRIFSITIKSSPHFSFTRMVICLHVTVKISSLNLYKNHMVTFILVTMNWSKMPLLRNIMKMGAKFRETPPCKKNKLTYLYWDAIKQLTKK